MLRKKKNFFENGKSIINILESNVFEVFYKVFPAKDYGTTLIERQNLNKEKLASTQWFRNNIVLVIDK